MGGRHCYVDDLIHAAVKDSQDAGLGRWGSAKRRRQMGRMGARRFWKRSHRFHSKALFSGNVRGQKDEAETKHKKKQTIQFWRNVSAVLGKKIMNTAVQYWEDNPLCEGCVILTTIDLTLLFFSVFRHEALYRLTNTKEIWFVNSDHVIIWKVSRCDSFSL